MTLVKICGVRQTEHAAIAAEAGADYVGLVFVPEQRRRVSLETAQAIGAAMANRGAGAPRLVGLFADQPLEEVAAVVATAGLHLAQLCGQESLEYCNRLADDAGVGIIKVFHVTGDAAEHSPEPDWAGDIQGFRQAGHLITLDRLVDGLRGGTGQTFDWSVAERLARQGQEFILAGGLTPANVARSVSTVRPWGVDVSSGVETDGAQDPEKIRAFVRNAKNASPAS